MKQILLSAFAVFELSFGQVIPPPPVIPTNPQPTEPAPTTTQAAPVVPIVPVVPITPTTPTTPATPTTTAGVPAAVVTAPPGFAFGAYGQLCPLPSNPARSSCQTTTDVLADTNGFVTCERSGSCCMCASITCGFGAERCHEAAFGRSAAKYVGDIRIQGNRQYGAVVSCNGPEACMGATITGDNIVAIDCDGATSCQYAKFLITDPAPQFIIECAGANACQGLEVEVRFSGPPPGYMCAYLRDPSIGKNTFEISGIECAANSACNMADITINNEVGCKAVTIHAVECVGTDACNAASFDFIGDVSVVECVCEPSCAAATGLEVCLPQTTPAFVQQQPTVPSQTQPVPVLQLPVRGQVFV